MSRMRLALAAGLLALTGATIAADTTVQEWSGTGGRTLRPFAVEDDWEIQWTAKGDVFQVFVFDGASGDMLGIVANQDKAGPGATYQRKGGRYYLQINALGEWSVRVVQLQK